MKALKFNQSQIPSILAKSRTSTWRLFDDKDVNVDDIVEFISSKDGGPFGYAKINEVTIKKICNINDSDMIACGDNQSTEQTLSMFRQYYGPNVTSENIVKMIKFEFLGEEVPDNEVKNTTITTEVNIYTDGGSRGNPGPSAAGFIITDMGDKTIAAGGSYLGITTNNQAEYQAVKIALQKAKILRCKKVHMFMDSLLVANQLNGIYKMRNRELWPIYQSINELMGEFSEVSITHIPRELNRLADEQVNKVLDKQGKTDLPVKLL